jgi:hypothetical protein
MAAGTAAPGKTAPAAGRAATGRLAAATATATGRTAAATEPSAMAGRLPVSVAGPRTGPGLAAAAVPVR